MEHYVVTVELDRRTPKEDHELDTIMEAVAPLHGALSTGDAGGLTISVTVPGEDLRQAVTIGLAAATAARLLPVRREELREVHLVGSRRQRFQTCTVGFVTRSPEATSHPASSTAGP